MKTTLVEADIFRKKGDELEFLILKRSENEIYPGLWQMVTGSGKEGEKAFETAIREIKEETDLDPVNMWVVPNINSFYMPEDDSLHFVPVFVVEITDQQEVQISPEHVEFKWVDREEACSLLAWEGQRNSVNLIEKYFTNSDPNYKFEQITL